METARPLRPFPYGCRTAADGRFMDLIDHHEAEEMAIAKMRRMLGG
jgi:hypothetical protein